MSDKLKVVHYINQFYGGFGGETLPEWESL